MRGRGPHLRLGSVVVAVGLAALVAAFSAAALAAPAGSSTSFRAAAAAVPVVVDTDMGPDDILALLYLTRRPEVDLVGVTVSGTGLVRCPVGARNALDVLAAVGRADVPVACGPEDPVAGFNGFPLAWREPADALFGLKLLSATRAPEAGGAVALLRSLLNAERAARPTVLMLSPATDLALALRAEPALVRRIGQVVAMAGAFGVPGNIGPGHERAEYNAWVDPTALREVLRSGVPMTFVPLDATNRVPATVMVSRALMPLRFLTPTATLAWETMIWSGIVGGGQFFWDPLAAVTVAQPALVRTDTRVVRVVVAPGPEQGRLVGNDGGVRARVVTGVDRSRFEVALLSTYTGRVVAPPSRRATVTLTTDGAGCALAGTTALDAFTGFGQDMATLETVNRSSRTMTHAVGALLEGKTLADLRAAARAATDTTEPPPWFEVFHTGQTPPHAAMTWEVGLPVGRFPVVCIVTPRAKAWVAGELTMGEG